MYIARSDCSLGIVFAVGTCTRDIGMHQIDVVNLEHSTELAHRSIWLGQLNACCRLSTQSAERQRVAPVAPQMRLTVKIGDGLRDDI